MRPGSRAMSAPTPERRRSPRFPCNLHATYRLVAGSLPRRRAARVLDLSAHGVRLETDQQLLSGTPLVVQLGSRAAGVYWTVSATVVHAAPLTGGRWVAGCRFVYPLSDASVQALLQGD